MKLHLPFALLAAVVSAVSYAEDVQYKEYVVAWPSTNHKGDKFTGTYLKDTTTGETLSGNVTVTGTNGVYTYETIKENTTVKQEDGSEHHLQAGTIKSTFTGDIGTAVISGNATKSSYSSSKGAKPGTVSAIPTEYTNAEGKKHTASHTYMTIGDGVTETMVGCAIGGGIPGDHVTGDKTIIVENNATVDYLVGGAYYNGSYGQLYGKNGTTGAKPENFEPSTTDSTITILVKMEQPWEKYTEAIG